MTEELTERFEGIEPREFKKELQSVHGMSLRNIYYTALPAISLNTDESIPERAKELWGIIEAEVERRGGFCDPCGCSFMETCPECSEYDEPLSY